MTQRAMQGEDPVADVWQGPAPGQSGQDGAIRQIAGALSALAGKVDRMGEQVAAGLCPKVTLADREAALIRAREFAAGALPKVRDSGVRERIEAELAVARYLTGE
jgi:hypothetical protein